MFKSHVLCLDHMFSSGDRQEVEIRGCTIWAIEVSYGMGFTLRY